MVSPPDGQSLSQGGTPVAQQNEADDPASKWIQRLLLSTGLVFFVGGLVVVTGGPGVVPFLSDSGTPTTVGGSGTATPTPDDGSAGTPTSNGTENSTSTPAGGGTGDGSTSTNGSDGSTPTPGSGGNETSTPTPTPEPIIGIG